MIRISNMRTLMLVLTLLIARAVSAAPSPASPADRKLAKEHYDRGTKHYNLGEFPEAADEYKAAYKIIPETVILYNIGQIYRLARDYDQALLFYNSYLANLKDATQRKEVEAKIGRLENLIKDKKAAAVVGQVPLSVDGKPADPKSTHPTATTEPVTKPADTVAKPNDTTPPDTTSAHESKAAATGNSARVQLLIEVIKTKRQGFRDCFDAWSKTHAGVEGHFILVLFLQADGKLEETMAAANDMQAPEVEACLTTYAKTLAYPSSPTGKTTKFTYPFNFKPLAQ